MVRRTPKHTTSSQTRASNPARTCIAVRTTVAMRVRRSSLWPTSEVPTDLQSSSATSDATFLVNNCSRMRSITGAMSSSSRTLLPASFWKKPPMELVANQLPDAAADRDASCALSSSSSFLAASSARRRAAARRASTLCNSRARTSPLVWWHTRHSTAQQSTAQHSTAQHSTAQHSTAQHSSGTHRLRRVAIKGGHVLGSHVLADRVALAVAVAIRPSAGLLGWRRGLPADSRAATAPTAAPALQRRDFGSATSSEILRSPARA